MLDGVVVVELYHASVGLVPGDDGPNRLELGVQGAEVLEGGKHRFGLAPALVQNGYGSFLFYPQLELLPYALGNLVD